MLKIVLCCFALTLLLASADIPEYANSEKSSVLKDFSISSLKISENPTQDLLILSKEAYTSLPWNVQHNLNQAVLLFQATFGSWNTDNKKSNDATQPPVSTSTQSTPTTVTPITTVTPKFVKVPENSFSARFVSP
uniref:Uncharacterized protein n=1 Tax=Caenorhabditis japonica TaxID=281687 RepID=A0A8R1IPX6_CAEJA